jgi:hypothetical protein
MELGTTSAVITFAIELDSRAHTYYAQVQETFNAPKLLEVIETLEKHHKKRKKRLQRFRRELVTEMILEPIHGFNREDFEKTIHITAELEIPEIVSALLTNEENMKNYLLMASTKLEFLPELSDQFQLLTEDIERNIQALKALQ